MEQKINPEIKEMDMISWQVVERLLLTFYEYGSLKKSHITSRSGLKYTSCMRYLEWLHAKMGFIDFELSTDLKQIQSIRLSSDGILFCKKRILINENPNYAKIQKAFLSA